jgi:hypothetical protein
MINHESERRSLRDFQEAQRKVYADFIADIPEEARRLVPRDWEIFVDNMHAMLFFDAEIYHAKLAGTQRKVPMPAEAGVAFRDRERGKMTFWKFKRSK